MGFISLSTILVRKEYLAKINNLPNHHGAGPLRRGAQCSCIGCIGLRPALAGPVVAGAGPNARLRRGAFLSIGFMTLSFYVSRVTTFLSRRFSKIAYICI